MAGRRRTVSFRSGCPVPVPTEGKTQEEQARTGALSFHFEDGARGSPLLAAVRLASVTAGRTKRKKKPDPLLSMAYATTAIPVEHYRVKRILGDGRCLFRALAQGVARHKGIFLSPVKEEMEADNLRIAVREALCKTNESRKRFRDVIKAIEQLEEPLPRYCRRLNSANFWGGEPELIVLSSLLRTPIFVYKEEAEYGRSGTGFVKIVEYGTDWYSGKKANTIPSNPVKLLYSGQNHYDLLID